MFIKNKLIKVLLLYFFILNQIFCISGYAYSTKVVYNKKFESNNLSPQSGYIETKVNNLINNDLKIINDEFNSSKKLLDYDGLSKNAKDELEDVQKKALNAISSKEIKDIITLKIIFQEKLKSIESLKGNKDEYFKELDKIVKVFLKDISDGKIKLSFFALAGSPTHWGHVIIALLLNSLENFNVYVSNLRFHGLDSRKVAKGKDSEVEKFLEGKSGEARANAYKELEDLGILGDWINLRTREGFLADILKLSQFVMADNEADNLDNGETGFLKKYLPYLYETYGESAVGVYVCGADHGGIFAYETEKQISEDGLATDVLKRGHNGNYIVKMKNDLPALDVISNLILLPYVNKDIPKSPTTPQLVAVQRKGYKVRVTNIDPKIQARFKNEQGEYDENYDVRPLSLYEQNLIIDYLFASNVTETKEDARKLFYSEIKSKYDNFIVSSVPNTVNIGASDIRPFLKEFTISSDVLEEINKIIKEEGIYSQRVIDMLKVKLVDVCNDLASKAVQKRIDNGEILTSNYEELKKEVSIIKAKLFKLPYSILIRSILSQEYTAKNPFDLIKRNSVEKIRA